MTFLNGILLGGAIAGTIPLAIHLLNRNRPRTIRWGAMQLLASQPKSKRRHIELEQILLLLLRISIPILLAMCMARPIASSLRAGGRSTTASIVIILDDSASMSASTGETSSFEKAKANAIQFIESLGRGSEVAMISTTDAKQPLIPTTADTQGAAQQARGLSQSHGAADVPASIEMAARYLSLMHNQVQRVVAFSDFQSASWDSRDAVRLKDAVQRLSALKNHPAVTLFDTGPFHTENSAIESIDFTRLPVTSNQKVRFDATLRNFGLQTRKNLQVEWKVDGLPAGNTPATIPPGQSTQISLERSFEAVGAHTIEAHIHGDAFSSDNAFYSTLNVQRSISVLIVSGRISSEPFQGETDFLELALHPKMRAAREGGVFSLKTIQPEDLTQKQLSEARVVVLANTPKLREPQVRLLETFVNDGGGLAFFPGTRTDPAWSNEQLYKERTGLLPAKLGAAATGSVIGSPGIEIAAGPYMHPSLNVFNSEQNSLSGIQIQTWYQLAPKQISNAQSTLASSLASSPAQVGEAPFIFLSLENGDPLFLEYKFGSGLVIQSAIPCSADWSNFPTRPAFVPAMQRLIGHLATGANVPAQLKVGEAVIAQLTGGSSAIVLRSPEGVSRTPELEKVGDRTLIRFEQTQQPGFYRLSGSASGDQCFAVNADRMESNPTRLGSDEIESLSKSIGATLVSNAGGLSDSLASTHSGREVWNLVLWVILFCLFAEIGLQQRFTPKAARSK